MAAWQRGQHCSLYPYEKQPQTWWLSRGGLKIILYAIDYGNTSLWFSFSVSFTYCTMLQWHFGKWVQIHSWCPLFLYLIKNYLQCKVDYCSSAFSNRDHVQIFYSSLLYSVLNQQCCFSIRGFSFFLCLLRQLAVLHTAFEMYIIFVIHSFLL